MEDGSADARPPRTAGHLDPAVTWRVAVDRDQCIGSGVCAGMAPERFRLVGGRSEPVEELAEPAEEILAAAESCPTEAITVRDDTGRVLAPE